MSLETLHFTHVFLRHGTVEQFLQPLYDGPYFVVNVTIKKITLRQQGKDIFFPIDRVETAFMLPDRLDTNTVSSKSQEISVTRTR